MATTATTQETHLAIENKTSSLGLEQSQSLLKIAFSTMVTGVLVFDKAGEVINYNETLIRMWQIPAAILVNHIASEFGQHIAGQLQNSSAFTEWFTEILKCPGIESEAEWKCTDERIIQSYIKPQRIQNQIAGCVVGFRDMTERKRAKDIMLLQQRAIEASADGIIIIDALTSEALITYVNPAFERITGYSAEEAIGRNTYDLLSKDQSQVELNNLRHAMQEAREGRAVIRSYRKNGNLFWCEMHLAPVRTEIGQITHYVGVITDVTERTQMQNQLHQQATHDTLTHLPNRLLLIDRIAQAITHANRYKNQLALLFIDLDRFKYVNDTYGHSKGDKLLKIAAKRLIDCLRESDTVARLGGDEFVVLITPVENENDLVIVAKKILKSLEIPYRIDELELNLSASIGISIYPKDGDATEQLLKNADIAMYRAKETGRNNFHFFTEELNQRILQRNELENYLRHALAKQELLLHYQPLLNLQTGQIFGFEALMRWQHPTQGLVQPLQFIGLAEETGLIIPMGEWLIETACNQAKAWQAAGLPQISMAINISSKQLEQHDFVERVKRIIQKTQINANCLMFELTESMIIENLLETVEKLKQLKMLGVSIVVDDFGTGYSSLSYLKSLPVDKIKIDKSFVVDLVTDEGSRALTKAIIAMAKSLKLRVLAEGVENKEQLEFLREAGCDEMQGFYFSKPVGVEECVEMLENDKKLADLSNNK